MAKFGFFSRSGVLKLALSTLILVIVTNNVLAATYDWLGGTSSDAGDKRNWYNESTGAIATTPPTSTDDVNIGVNTTYISGYVLVVPVYSTIPFTNSPLVTVNTKWKSLTFGTVQAISLTVNTVTLTITGNIVQQPIGGLLTSGFNTTLLGTGTISCSTLQVGDNSTSDLLETNNLLFISKINSLSISGNLNIYSSDISLVLGIGANNAQFSLRGGTTSITGQILTNNTKLGLGLFSVNGIPKFSIDNPSGSTLNPILMLANAAPINASSAAGSIDFYNNTGGTGTSTVYYNGTTQTVYTNNTASLDNNPSTYQYLQLTGSGTKTPNGGSLLINNDFTTTTTTVLFNSFNPIVLIGNNWSNSSNITQGSGDITIGGSLTNNSGGTLNLGTANLSIAGNYTNNVGGTYTQGTGTTFFNGTGPQALVDNSSTGTTFKKVNFSGSGTATMSAGTNNVNFSVASTGILTMSNTAKLVAGTTVAAGGASYLTLSSDINGSASVDKITTTAPISGNVNVQRFLNGGSTYNAGRWVYRNYRLMSSPVNAGKVGVNYPYTINYLAAGAIVTGAKSTFSTIGGNPTIYLYSEDYTPSNATFTSGNFKGVSDISNLASPYTLAITDNGTNKALYVGNGFMFFFRGDNIHSVGTNPGKTTSPFVAPESVVFTATGFLNQNSYTVNNWYNGSNLLYTTVTTPAPGNAAVKGYNLVGNPYACAIDWNTVNTGGITATNVNPSIYVFNPVNNQYNTYSSSSHLGNPGTFTGLIASGQGFYVQANNSNPLATPALVFNETAKSPATQPTGTNLLMGTPAGQIAVQQLFRLKLRIDSLNYDDIVIGFNSSASPKFNGMEDAQYLAGPGAPEGLSSLSSDSVRLAINFLPLPKQTPQVIRLDVEAINSGLLTLQKTQLDAIPQIYEIWLMDKYKKDSLDIRNNANYAFNINKSDTASFGKNRFEIVIRQNPALGIHLLNFTAAKAANGAQTTWKVENEENYTNFTVERSTDNGVNFNVLGGQLSNAQGTYSYLDNNPAKAVDLYRLKIEDMNGTITYSKVIALAYSNPGNNLANNNVNVYPNPASGVINLSIAQNNVPTNLSGYQLSSIPALASSGSDAGSQSYNIKIINITGSVVKTAISSQPEWHGNVDNLPPGTYIVQVLNNSDKTLVGKTTFIKL